MSEPGHAYPRDLARFVLQRWDGAVGSLPGAGVLEHVLSVCYQVSLLREEERPVTFRLILVDARHLPAGSPPSGLHALEFPEALTFGVEELRRLSPAADYERSLIGVSVNDQPGIWGLVHSGGPRVPEGGSPSHPLPADAPVVLVSGPGRIEVRRGSTDIVARLEGGRLTRSSETVYDSTWLPAAFAPARAELMDLHAVAREEAGEPWAELDPDFTRRMAQRMVRRLISTVRDARHGGTIVIVPPEMANDLYDENRFVRLKYRFADDRPRRRFRALIVGLMNALARVYGRSGHVTVGWEEYEAEHDRELSELQDALLEFSHLVASLASVDGAVVMTKRFELLGFGGEISGGLSGVATVARALDIEGDRVRAEPAEGVGTRHRSAYRLCATLPGVIAVVLSQDGSARFVTQRGGTVTYWDQA